MNKTHDGVPTATPAYTLLILAGGEGRRMGGQDKGLQCWRGKPLVEHLLENIPRLERQCLISCNRNFERYQHYGETVADQHEGFQGPLAGIAAGLTAATRPYVLVLPCDSPHPPPELLAALFQAMQDRDSDICFANDGVRDQYLFALIQRRSLDSLRQYLAEGERSVWGWYRRLQAQPVRFPAKAQDFANFNTLEILQEAGK